MKLNKHNLIKYYIILYPFCDIIYTLTENIGLNIPININQFIRGLGVILFFTCIKDIKNFLKVILIALWLIISLFYHISTGLSTNVITDFAFMLKVLNNFILFYAFMDMYKMKKISFDEITTWLVYSSYIAVGSILLSYIGLGLTSYGNGRIGVKGLFTIQSTITAYLLVILPLYYYKFRKIIDWKMILCIIALLSIGSKTGVFGTMMAYIFMIIIDIRINSANGKISKNKFFSYIVILFMAITIGIYAMHEYIIYLLNLYYSKAYYYSFESFLLSNRNDQIKALQRSLRLYGNDINTIARIFLGMGYTGGAAMVQKVNSHIQAIERDFHGLYYYFGILILILTLIVLFKVLYSGIRINIKMKFKEIRSYLCFLIVCIGILYAYLGGHIFYEAMNQIPFWSVAAFLYYDSKLNKKRVLKLDLAEREHEEDV